MIGTVDVEPPRSRASFGAECLGRVVGLAERALEVPDLFFLSGLVALECLNAGAAGVELRGDGLALRLAASSSACAALRSAVSVPFSAALASSCMPRRAACATEASRSARTSARSFCRRGRGRRLAAALGLGLHPGRVDVGVRLDRRIEIAIDRVRPLGLTLQVGAQCVGIGPASVSSVRSPSIWPWRRSVRHAA